MHKNKYEWHEWFAWFPVCVRINNDHVYKWGCTVKRKMSKSCEFTILGPVPTEEYLYEMI